MYEDKAGVTRVRAVEEYPGESLFRDEHKPFTGYRTENWERMEDLFVGVTINTVLAFLLPALLIEKFLAGLVGVPTFGRWLYLQLNAKEKR
jgi:hypothetical protein